MQQWPITPSRWQGFCYWDTGYSGNPVVSPVNPINCLGNLISEIQNVRFLIEKCSGVFHMQTRNRPLSMTLNSAQGHLSLPWGLWKPKLHFQPWRWRLWCIYFFFILNSLIDDLIRLNHHFSSFWVQSKIPSLLLTAYSRQSISRKVSLCLVPGNQKSKKLDCVHTKMKMKAQYAELSLLRLQSLDLSTRKRHVDILRKRMVCLDHLLREGGLWASL